MIWVIRFVANAIGLAVAAWLLPDISIRGDTDEDRLVTLLVVAAIFGVVNSFVRPIVALLSLPLYVLTIGLMYFVVNALMLMLTSWIADQFDIGFHVDGFWTAVAGGVVVALVTWSVTAVLPEPEPANR